MAIAKPGEIVPLENVALCAIVCDEMMNPAGGIRNWLNRTLPYVGRGRIVDTGSVDGTREVLEEMQAVYPHLEVVDHKFDGYGASRNVSLEVEGCGYALVLDADEILTPADFEKIRTGMAEKWSMRYDVGFLHIDPDLNLVNGFSAHITRILSIMKDFPPYIGSPGEGLMGGFQTARLPVRVKHFVPDAEGRRVKLDNWYNLLRSGNPAGKTPSETPGVEKWKQPNPHLEKIIDEGFRDWAGKVDMYPQVA